VADEPGHSRLWREHRLLAAAVRAVVVVAPFAASVAAGLAVGAAVPARGTLAWWAAVLAVSTVCMAAVDRLGRRLLPLAVLLDLNLLFPDQAPSRFRVALKSGSVKHVHEQAPESAETIVTLVAALGAHHRPSRKHSERVRAYTELVAEELHLSAEDRHRLRWAALLHDIGKVDVPVEVLNGTGPLSDEGWRVIHRHPTDGARLITPLRQWLGPWAATVEQHHERFDGSGYPAGLTGDAICTGARIVAVADTFEAMTARRSYQEPMPLDQARARLADLSGTHFDPAVVRAFLAVSLGKLRWAYGPLAWLAEAPALAAISGMAPAAAAGARAGAAALSVAVAASAAGVSHRPVDVAGVTFSRSARGIVRAAAQATAPPATPPAAATPAASTTAPAPSTTTTTTTATTTSTTITVPTVTVPVTVPPVTVPPITVPTLPLPPRPSVP
jgi:putative nucleotidyltransferase with HDIG domain